MKTIIKNTLFVTIVAGTLFSQGIVAFAQYDTGTTYPYYDTGTTYPYYDTGTTYPYYDTGTTYPYYDTGTTYPNYDTGTPLYSYTPSYTYTPPSTIDIPTTYTTPTYSTSNYGTVYGNTGSPTTFINVTTGNWGTGWTNPGWTNPGTTCPAGTTLVNNQCVINQTTCPPNSTLINGQCVINNTTCPTGYTLQNGVCINTNTQCPVGSTLVNGVCQINNTSCPTGSTLVNGQCVLNSTICPTGSTLVNGACVINNTSCPAGTTLQNGQCVGTANCPTGFTYQNGQCVGTTTCPPNSTLINGVCQAPISCPAGTTYVNGVCQGTGTTVCPAGSVLVGGVCQINTTSCPYGSVLIGGICQITTTNCPTGTVLVNGVCQSSYQTCWDGSRIPGNQMCPSQFKTCANGSVVPINQICYQTCPDGTTVMEGGRCFGAPTPRPVTPTVKFNNVVTSVTTQITNNTARCNGIGLIANSAQSTGWFEYGETTNLGRVTTKTSIGSAVTSPFSNTLTNLKPSTTYFCRAVMSNEYGVVKGEIVKFTTKATAVTYVKPAPTTKPVSKKPVTKNEVVCIDGSSVTVGSQSSSVLLNQGQKLVTMQVEKVQGDFVAGKDVIFRLSYKNISDSPLVNVLVKVVLPQGITFVGSTGGNYDPSTNSLNLGLQTIPPYSDGAITWTMRVGEGAEIGKSLVTTGYVLYMIPDASGKTPVQDEVTSYVVSTVMPANDLTQDGAKTVSNKKVIGAGVISFLPQTLIEWLALIAILFIIGILGRSMYASFKQEDKRA